MNSLEIYNEIACELVAKVGCAYENKEIQYWQAVEIFDDAKKIFMRIVNEEYSTNGKIKNEN